MWGSGRFAGAPRLELPLHIPTAALVGRMTDGVIRGLRGPQTESLLVPGREDRKARGYGHGDLHPIVAVEHGGTERLRGMRTPASGPFTGERVHPFRDEPSNHGALKGQLIAIGLGEATDLALR